MLPRDSGLFLGSCELTCDLGRTVLVVCKQEVGKLDLTAGEGRKEADLVLTKGISCIFPFAVELGH